MRALLIDDHRLFRDGMKSLLMQWRADLQIAEASTLDLARKALQEQAGGFDLVLLDLTLPDSSDALHTMQQVLQVAGEAPVVAVSMLPPNTELIDAGARGYIHKSESAHVMLASLDLVLAGGNCIPAGMLKPEPTVLDEFHNVLSERQQQVLTQMASGLSNKEIARVLGISEGTVKVHVHRVLQQLGATSRAKATLLAQRRGWLQAAGTRH